MKYFLPLTLFLSLFLAACGGDKYGSMAKDLCSCMQPMANLQKEINQLVAEGRQNEISSLFEKADAIDTEGAACIEALEKKHGIIKNAEEEAKAMEAMRKACPDIVALMEGAEDMDPEDMPMDEASEMMPDTLNQE